MVSFLHPRRARSDGDVVVEGPARVDRRTKDLAKRLQPGEIAIINHQDIDRVAAESLIDAGAAGVVNAALSITGRYPNHGPLLLAQAGIPILDGVGTDVLDRVYEGQVVRVDGDRLLADGELVANGTRQTERTITDVLDVARSSLGAELEQFAENTLEYIRKEGHLLVDQPDIPTVPVEITGPSRADRRARASTTRATWPCCARAGTSARTGRCSSASTGAPTRSSRWATSPT